MEIIIIIVGVLAFFALNSRIGKLEREVFELKQSKGQVQASQPAAATPSTPQAPPPVTPVMPEAPKEPAFIAWLKEDFLLKLGAFLLLLAVGWFVSYAFANNWIGPMGRIALGLAAGVGISALGVWRIRSYLTQGTVFVALGATVILLTVWAAREFYGFFTPLSALLLMFAAAVFVAYVSVRYKSESLALSGLVLASIAPLLTVSPEPDIMSLYSYLLIVVLGTLWVVQQTGSRSLITAALIIMLLYSAPAIFGGLDTDEELIGLLFAFAFTAIFFVANIVSIIHRQTDDAKQGHVVAAILTGLYLIIWISSMAYEAWQSSLFLGWAAIFALGTWFVYMRTSFKVPAYIYGGVGIALLGAATAAEFSGATLTIAYILEITALVWAAAQVLSDKRIAERLCFLYVVPVLLSFDHMDSRAWDTGVWHSDFAVLALLAGSLALVGAKLYQLLPPKEPNDITAGAIVSALSALYGLALIWLVSHGLLSEDVATMAALIVYTVIGLTLYIQANERGHTPLKVAGGLLLGFVVARLLLIEVWDMDIVGRIITFFAVGVLLMSTAFIGRKKPDIISDSPEQPVDQT